MPDFIDVTIRVRKEKMGQLVVELPQFVQPVSFRVVGSVEQALTTASTVAVAMAKGKGPRGAMQATVLATLKLHPRGMTYTQLREIHKELGSHKTYQTVGRLIRAKQAKKMGDLVIATEK